jgi:hypothetical protein
MGVAALARSAAKANAVSRHGRVVGAELSKTAVSGARTGLPCLRDYLAAGAREAKQSSGKR